MKTLISSQSASIALLTSLDEIEEIIAILESVALAEGWHPGNDLKAYIDRSIYLAAMDREDIVGGIQLVLGEKERPLPYKSIWPEMCDLLGSQTGHVLILALDKDYRGGMGFFGLLSLCLWRECMERGIEELWLEATPAKLKVYRKIGWPLCVRGELREHWGEPCVLCSLSVTEAEAGVRSRSYWRGILALADKYTS